MQIFMKHVDLPEIIQQRRQNIQQSITLQDHWAKNKTSMHCSANIGVTNAGLTEAKERQRTETITKRTRQRDT